MKTKLQDFALVAEVISALAVTVSLIFVGFQIQSNTKASEASTFQAISALEVEMLLAFSASPERAAAMRNFHSDPYTLSGDEFGQGYYSMVANFRHWENLYLQYQSGFISEEAWITRAETMHQGIVSPGGRYVIDNAEGMLGGPFLEYAEGVIRRADGGEPRE